MLRKLDRYIRNVDTAGRDCVHKYADEIAAYAGFRVLW